MKLKHFSFAIMLINMLIMSFLLYFTHNLARDMNIITEMFKSQAEEYPYG